MSERYLTVDEAAAELGTTVRFVRRLISERRIGFIKYGRPIRVPMSAIADFITAGTVAPRTPRAH